MACENNSVNHRELRIAIPLAVTYFVTASLTVSVTRFGGGVAFLWAAGGFLLGALVATDRRHWPTVISCCGVASFMATSLFGLGLQAALPLAMINMVEATLGAWLLRRVSPSFGGLASSSEIALLIAVAGVALPVLTAFPGAAVATVIADVAFWPNWLAWSSGHALGAVTIAPFVLLLRRGEIGSWVRQAGRAQCFETATLLVILAGVSFAVFYQTRFPLLFLPFLPMMTLVFRIGRLGAVASLILIAAVGGVLTLRGLGPIALMEGSAGFRAQFFQLYLASATLMVLPAAGALKSRKSTLEALQEQAVLHRLIFDRSGDVIMTLERQGRIRFVSSSSTALLGLSPEMLIGRMPHEIIHSEDIDRVVAVHRDVILDPDRTFTVDYRVAIDGREIGWFESHARAMLDETGVANGAVVVIRDVSERKAVELRLSDAAMTDPLTGVANRRAFDAALTSRFEASIVGPAAVVIFDLDHFKAVNDRFGHAAGDRVLSDFANVLRATVRSEDLVARLGGEEFAAVIRGDIDAARTVCERVRKNVEEMQSAIGEGLSVRVTVSAGIAPIAPFGSAASALAAADAALYRAKAEGRNRLLTAMA
ncbi:diguanylate cyclase [Sphingomonas sp. SAFR-052]|uniref:sensor domain-containing diguanylate cyclase n=1 Tax=Sphingomonas sp. SAFR-052 TaxID=3436867 RepID=UPI003F80711F